MRLNILLFFTCSVILSGKFHGQTTFSVRKMGYQNRITGLLFQILSDEEISMLP